MKDSGCWGKTWRRASPAVIHVHRLEHHGLDVLATLDALFARDPGLLASLARALGMPLAAARCLVRWCALLHDAGKVARAFQGKSCTGWMSMRGSAGRPVGIECAHDMVGFLAMRTMLDDAGDLDDPKACSAITAVIAAAFFHHGRPRASETDYIAPSQFSESSDRPRFTWLVEQAEALVGTPEWPSLEGARRASWLLTGIVSLVDGLGSAVSDRIMEMAVTVPAAWLEDGRIKAVGWDQYLDVVAVRVAAAVIHDIGDMAFIPLPPPEDRDSHEILASMAGIAPSSFIPSPLQAKACEVPMDGQFIAVIEDVTGSGKTEASAMLVRRAIHARIAEGGYWGLPTMATANGLYRRFKMISPFLHGGNHSLVLAHGARDDVPLFRSALRDVLGNPVSSSPDAKEVGGAQPVLTGWWRAPRDPCWPTVVSAPSIRRCLPG